ncbi:unnamed protein product [Urochloa humidicola]
MARSRSRSPLPSPGPHCRPSPSVTPAPATTSHSPTPRASDLGAPSPSSLSPDAAPFYPSGGRGKELRWADELPEEDDDLSPRASYREVLMRQAMAGSTRSQAAAPSPSPVPVATSAPSRTDPPEGKRDGRRPSDSARSGRHRQRRRGQMRLVHGLPLRRPDPEQSRGRLRSVVVQPRPVATAQRAASPPPVDADGFTKVLSRRERTARRRRQRQRQRQHMPPPPPKRIRPEMAGRCLNCLSYKHMLAQCASVTSPRVASVAMAFATWLGTASALAALRARSRRAPEMGGDRHGRAGTPLRPAAWLPEGAPSPLLGSGSGHATSRQTAGTPPHRRPPAWTPLATPLRRRLVALPIGPRGATALRYAATRRRQR